MESRNFRSKKVGQVNIPAVNECNIDFDDAIEIFKERYMRDDWSRRTLDFHIENFSNFRKYLATQVGNQESISRDILEKYVMSMRSAGRKKNTINGRIKTLRVFFRVLLDNEYIGCNPAISLRSIRGESTEIIPFDDEQVKALLNIPNKDTFAGLRDWMIMQILLDSGIRLSELCNIQLSDINIKDKRLYIRKGKGRKSRTVFFGNDTRKAIQKYLRFTGITDNDEYLVLNQDGGRLKPRSVQERISIHAAAAGIKGVRPSPHTFRHTFAKSFLMNNGDSCVLRDLLGHNSMSTVIIYLKLFGDDLQKKYQGKSPVDRLFSKKHDD